jgi:hypothetical protein
MIELNVVVIVDSVAVVGAAVAVTVMTTTMLLSVMDTEKVV